MSTLFELPQHHVFFLCPDKEYARGLRRHLVDSCGVVYGQAGTLDELVELAHQKRLLDLYNIGAGKEGEASSVEAVIRSFQNSFWSKSAVHDIPGVASTLFQSLEILIKALGEHADSSWGSLSDCPRVNRRLSEMQGFMEACYQAGCLPDRIQKMLEILRCEHTAITPIKVIKSSHFIENGRLIEQFLNLLDNDCQSSIHVNSSIVSYCQAMQDFDSLHEQPSAAEKSNLYLLQSNLYQFGNSADENWNQDEQSVQILKCRDRIEALEVVAGMIQSELSGDSTLVPADFAVLLPANFDSHAQLRHVFERAGLNLSNFEYSRTERNLAGELFRYALMAFSGATPKLALKSFLTNPLLNWSSQTAHQLASSIDQFGFSVKSSNNLTTLQEELIKLLNDGVSRSDLSNALNVLKANTGLDGFSEQQVSNFSVTFEKLTQDAGNLSKSYEEIVEGLDVSPIKISHRQTVYLDGVTVVYEDVYPWRDCQFLYVMDFNAGSFPSVASNPVTLSNHEWNQLSIRVPELVLQRHRRDNAKQLFRKQLMRTKRSVTLIVPAFIEVGMLLKPSESLIDIAVVAKQLEDPEKLMLDVGSAEDRARISSLKFSSTEIELATRFTLLPKDLELNRDLLALRTVVQTDELTGNTSTITKPQSPSALDDLLICPLGWLLKQLQADPRVWEPDSFTPMTSGLIAHDVLEGLFTGDDAVVPSEHEIDEKSPDLFKQAILKKAPYLNTSIWQVERNNLLAKVKSAAKAWAALLTKLEAKVVAPELSLQGTFDGQPIHGQTDCVISLPDQGVLVVDFKTSKADKYDKRMRAKVDLQASLYQEMLRTGGPKNPKDVEKAKNVDLKKLSGVIYFTLNDRLATSNYVPPTPVNGWNAVTGDAKEDDTFKIHQDVSSEAMDWLRSRFAELRNGRIPMVKESEIKEYEKLGFGSYIYSLSPLLQSSIVRDVSAAADEEDDE